MSDQAAIIQVLSDDDVTKGHGVKSIDLNDRPRARKSTSALESCVSPLPKRQALLPGKEKPKLMARQLNSDNVKFMENFDPENSSREKRKNDRRSVRNLPGAVYDSAGVHIASGKDLCDCLQESCAGCHFPCPKCSSNKCGIDCRVNRKFIYDVIEYHGYEFIVKNPLSG